MIIDEILIADIGYSQSNDFYFSILGVSFENSDYLRSLFMFSFSKEFFYIGFLFFIFKIFDHTD